MPSAKYNLRSLNQEIILKNAKVKQMTYLAILFYNKSKNVPQCKVL